MTDWEREGYNASNEHTHPRSRSFLQYMCHAMVDNTPDNNMQCHVLSNGKTADVKVHKDSFKMKNFGYDLFV